MLTNLSLGGGIMDDFFFFLLLNIYSRNEQTITHGLALFL